VLRDLFLLAELSPPGTNFAETLILRICIICLLLEKRLLLVSFGFARWPFALLPRKLLHNNIAVMPWLHVK